MNGVNPLHENLARKNLNFVSKIADVNFCTLNETGGRLPTGGRT